MSAFLQPWLGDPQIGYAVILHVTHPGDLGVDLAIDALDLGELLLGQRPLLRPGPHLGSEEKHQGEEDARFHGLSPQVDHSSGRRRGGRGFGVIDRGGLQLGQRFFGHRILGQNIKARVGRHRLILVGLFLA